MAAPPDSTKPTARDLLELMKTVESLPSKTAAATAKRVASQPIGKTAADVAKGAAKTVGWAVSPGLELLQQAGLRSGSMTAGALDPVLKYGEEVGQGGFQTAAPDVLSRSAAGAVRGLTRMEPPYGKPETAVADVFRAHGLREGAYKNIPGASSRLQALMLLTGGNPKAIAAAAKGAEFLSGPEGAALGTEIYAGDKINEVARGTGAVINQFGLPDKLAVATERIANLPGIRKVTRPLAETFQVMPMIPRRIRDPRTGKIMVERGREKMLDLVRRMAGERGRLESRWGELVARGPTVIEEGARRFNMTVEDRQKYLETIREHASRQGVAGLGALSVGPSPLITRSEAAYLNDLEYMLDTSIPATRRMAGQKPGRLNEAANRAGEKATSAIARVEKLAEEMRQIQRRDLPTYVETPGGGFERVGKLQEIGQYNIEQRRRDLIKAISDADFAIRAFSRTSRHFIEPPLIDRKNLFRYTTDELLGITEQLTTKEMVELGKVPFSKGLLPIPLTEEEIANKVPERLYRGFIRPKPESGLMQARVFDKMGNEVWRQDAQDAEAGIRAIRTKFPEAGEQIGSSGAPWMTEKKTRGPYPSPLARMSEIKAEILDRDKYFMNYLPRYQSEELTAKTKALRKGKKGGISTSIGGARIAAPTTTHEQARRMLRERFVRESREARSGATPQQIEEPLQGLTEALDTHIKANASGVSKARFLGRVRQSFGIEVTDDATEKLLQAEGWRPLGKLPGVTSGMEKDLAETFRRSYVPESVFNGIKALDEALTPVSREGFSKFWHDLLQVEKTYLTVANPRFNVRNRAWEVMASYMRGNKNPKNWLDADKLLMGDYDHMKVPGFDMTGAELRKQLELDGVLGPDVNMADVRVGRGSKMKNRMADLVQEVQTETPRGYVIRYQGQNYRYNTRELTQAVEQFQRRFPDARGYSIQSIQDRAVRKQLRQGVGPKEMMQAAGRDVSDAMARPLRAMSFSNLRGEARARVAHWFWAYRDAKMGWTKARREVAFTIFDYGRDFLTAREAKLREFIPFYTWFRRIVPFTIQNTIQRPGELAKLGMLQAHISAMNGVTPEEMEYLGRTYLNSVGVVLPDQADQRPGTKRVLNVPYGGSDPSQFMSLSEDLGDVAPLGKFTGPIRGVAQTLRPSLQLPMSFLYAMGTSGEKYTGEIVKLPSASLLIPDKVKERLGIQVRKDGLPWGPSTLIPIIRYLQGGPGEAAGGFASKNPRVRARANAWLTGLSIDPEVPFEQNKISAELMRFQYLMNQIGIKKRGAIRMGKSEAQFGLPESTGANP